MKRFWQNLARVNHNYYSFISGVVISISVELAMGLLSGDSLPEGKWTIITSLSSALTLISSIFWSILAWNLDAIQNSAREAPDFLDDDDIWDQLILPKIGAIKLYFIIAVSCFVVGLLILVLRFRV
jgi:uncharacterized membrane protein